MRQSLGNFDDFYNFTAGYSESLTDTIKTPCSNLHQRQLIFRFHWVNCRSRRLPRLC